MRSRRPLLFGAIVLAHLLLLAMIARQRPGVALAPVDERPLTVLELPPPMPVPSVKPPPPAIVVAASASTIETAPPPIAPHISGCAVAASVQAALRDEPDVAEAVAALPPDARSVANTVMLWDGGWIAPSRSAPSRRSDPIREAVGTALAAQPPECLDQPMAGPRVFLVEQAAGTASLVIGSGVWRWRDVLVSASRNPPPKRA